MLPKVIPVSYGSIGGVCYSDAIVQGKSSNFHDDSKDHNHSGGGLLNLFIFLHVRIKVIQSFIVGGKGNCEELPCKEPSPGSAWMLGNFHGIHIVCFN